MALFNHDGHSGSRKGSQHIAPDVPGRDLTLIHQFGATRPAYGHNTTIYGHIGPFGGPMAPPNGHSGPGKGSQHIAPDVPGLDPTSIHADPPVWSRLACLWPQYDHLWPFRAVWRPYGAPGWPFWMQKMVPTHRPGCART